MSTGDRPGNRIEQQRDAGDHDETSTKHAAQGDGPTDCGSPVPGRRCRAPAIEPVFSTIFGGAIRGYDPVAYFTEGRPVEGKRAHRHEWMGATWSFASAENRAAFVADPEKFAPRYGGYCAWAVSQGYTASIDPDAWRIVDGALYPIFTQLWVAMGRIRPKFADFDI